MKLRNMECRKCQMQQIIERNIPVCNLQGLFTDNNTYLAGFEAIDMEDSNIDEFGSILSLSEINLKLCFCKQLSSDCKFYLLLHTRDNSSACSDSIYIKEFGKDANGLNAVEIDCQKFDEDQFLIWWKSHSSFRQIKSYRPDAQKYLASSYFDNLLAKDVENGQALSWTFNIDGFVYDPKQDNKITALIENRISNKSSVQNYDPSVFFLSDIKVWSALKMVATKLDVPLILCTYSRMPGCENMMGAAVIESATGKLSYKDKTPPNRNIIKDPISFKKWLEKII